MAHLKGADLRSLEIFQTICQTRNMGKAAKQLSMTQPAVSQNLARLENALGTLLVDRAQRPLRLTSAGEVLRDRSGKLLLETHNAFEATRRVGKVPLSWLKMSVPGSLASTLIPAFYIELMNHLQPEGITVSCDQVVDLSRRFLDREIDIIISSDAMNNMDGLERRVICQEGYMLALPASYTGPTDSLQKIVEHLPLIRITSRNAMGQDVERHLQRIGIEIPHQAAFDAPSAVIAVVASGQGFSILTPLCLLEGRTKPSNIICRSLPTVAFSRTLTLISRSGEMSEVADTIFSTAIQVLNQEVLPRVWIQIGRDIVRFDIAKTD